MKSARRIGFFPRGSSHEGEHSPETKKYCRFRHRERGNFPRFYSSSSNIRISIRLYVFDLQLQAENWTFL